MKRILIAFSALLLFLSAPLAAETVEGYLIDKMCSAKVATDGVAAAKAHTKECALMPKCKDSGYGVVTEDGKFLKFDEDGDRMVVKLMGITGGKDNLKVAVDGEVKGSSIIVKAVQFT